MTSKSKWPEASSNEFVTLVAGGQSFCIEITQIREIRRWSTVTAMPHAPHAVLGLMNLRGAVIPIVDLAARLGFEPVEATSRNVVIVVSVKGRTVGLLVDAVSEILTIKGDMLREAPDLQDDETIRFISGVIALDDEMTRIIDLQVLLPQSGEVAA